MCLCCCCAVARQGEVLIALGRSRVVSRVPSRPLMAAALEVAQQAGEGGAPRPRPALPAEGGPTARQPQPQPGAAGKQRASAGDGGAAPASVAGRVATPAAPHPPEPAGRPVLAASVGSGREAGGAGDGGAVPATAAGEEQLAAPAAALDRTPSKPKRGTSAVPLCVFMTTLMFELPLRPQWRITDPESI